MNLTNISSVTIETQESYDCDESSQRTIDVTISSKTTIFVTSKHESEVTCLI